MQLLYSQAAPAPEFVALSLLLKAEVNDDSFDQMRKPVLLPSPTSTISQTTGTKAVEELHQYLRSTHRSLRSNTARNDLANALLKEDEKFLTATQVFRPAAGQGIGLHYQLIRERTSLAPLAQLVLRSASKSTTSDFKARGIEKEVVGVIFCVAMTGLPSIYITSQIHYSMSQRINDCVNIMSKTGTEDRASCAMLLTSILLTETERRLTNAMATAQENHLFANRDDGRGGILNPKKKSSINYEVDFENPLSMNSADQARLMIERLAVLSVAETDTIFNKYEGKSNEKNSKSRRRKAGRDADLDGFDFRGEPQVENKETISSSVSVSDASSVKSGSSRLLKQPKNDTARIPSAGKARQGSVPALMASNKDTGAKSRRQMGADQTGRSHRQPSDVFQTNWTGEAAVQSSANSFDPFSIPSTDTASMTSDTSTSRQSRKGGFGSHELPMEAGFSGDAFGLNSANSRRRPQSNQNTPGTGGGPRMSVNVALNEDLTCIYKVSRMTSCSVEGVVQVQVKPKNLENAPPFFLTISDPSNHILSIQENKKYAADVSRGEDFKFKVNVPKVDAPQNETYFPVMRYKCAETLRPVPIVSFRPVPSSRIQHSVFVSPGIL